MPPRMRCTSPSWAMRCGAGPFRFPRASGWWPRFDVEVMTRTLAEADNRSYWELWERVECPALIVRGGDGSLPREDAEMMVTRGRDAKLVELADAKHDLHLDHPAEWRQALSEFLDSLAP